MDYNIRAQIVQQSEQIYKEAALKRKNQPYAIVGLLGLGLFLLSLKATSVALPFWILAGTVGVLWWLYRSPYMHADNVFRSLVMPKIAKCVDPHLKYSMGASLSQSETVSSQLFNVDFNRFQAEDQFEGKWKGVDFRVCELRLRKVSGSGKNQSDLQVFSGLVFTFEYPKKFNSKTVLYPDFAESVFGGYVAGLLQDFSRARSNLKRVQLEHPDFEKHFQVLSENETEARYLFTPKKMELMLELKKMLGVGITASFYQGHMYLAYASQDVHYGLKGPEDLDLVIGKVEQVFQLITRVIDTLDLDNTLYKSQA